MFGTCTNYSGCGLGWSEVLGERQSEGKERNCTGGNEVAGYYDAQGD